MSEAYRKHTQTHGEGRHLVVGEAVAARKGEIVMSMLTLQVPTAVCETLFRTIVGEKYAEHFLTRKNSSRGTDCAVVLWGATVDPESMGIVPCEGQELLEQLGLWERIYEWYKKSTSNKAELKVADLLLSDSDILHLDSTYKLYFLMNCSPDHTAVAAMKRRVEAEIKSTAETLKLNSELKFHSSMRLQILQKLGQRNVSGSEAAALEDRQNEAASLAKRKHLWAMMTLLDKHRHATIRLHTEGTPLLTHCVGDWQLRLLVGITESELLEAGSELLHNYCGDDARSWCTAGASSQCGCDSCDEHLLAMGQFGIGWNT